MKAFKIIILSLMAVVLIHGICMVTVDAKVHYTETKYRSEKLNAALDGYVIALVTDTHATPPETLREIADRIDTRSVDLLLLGGDLMYGENERESMEILSGIHTTDGIYGVEGNHDKQEKLFAAMREYGITPLDNEGIYLRDGIYLGGVRDLWNAEPDVKKTLAGASPDDFTLLLCHNPDVGMQQDTSKASLMLSGHTHGGQVTVLGLWAPLLTYPGGEHVTEYGQRLMHGWCKGAYGTDIYVSRGVEPSMIRHPRVFAPPEVVFLTLQCV